MTVIIVFYLNEDNFENVILRDESRTIEDQVKQYETERKYVPNSCYGIEKDVIEQ